MSNNILVQDDWTYLASQNVSSENPAWGNSGGPWVVSSPNGSVFNANQSFVPTNSIRQDTGVVNHYCECTINFNGAGRAFGGPFVSGLDGNTHVSIIVEPTFLEMRSHTNSANGPIGPQNDSRFTRTHVDGDLYRLEVTLYGSLRVLVNGALVIEWPIGSQTGGTFVGIVDQAQSAGPNYPLYGPLKSGRVQPDLRSLRWRDIQRWSGDTEGYQFVKVSSFDWVRFNQNIEVTGNFELRITGRIAEDYLASAQNTSGNTFIRYRGSFNRFEIRAENGANIANVITSLPRTDAEAGINQVWSIKRLDDLFTITYNGIVLVSQANFPHPFRFNAFGRGSNTAAGGGARYSSYVLQLEDNTIPIAFLPYERESQFGRNLINRAPTEGPFAPETIINPTTITTSKANVNHWFQRYQEGELVGLERENNQPSELFDV